MCYSNASFCDYSNPRNGEPWICEKPSSNICSKIVNVKYQALSNPISFEDICLKFGCHKLTTSNTTVTILSDIDKTVELQLPPCSSEFLRPSNSHQVTGYMKNKRWNSLICSHSLTSFQTLPTVLTNKTLYFFGDSTIRQFFLLIAQVLKLTVKGSASSGIWQQPRIAHYGSSPNHNITMYYRAHGPPLRNPGPPNTRPYISDSILGIPVGGQDVYVIFNIGAHLFHHHPRFFIHRVEGIKKAILQHQKVFPSTRFIVRGLNVVKWPEEWSIYRINVLLHEAFAHMKNVMFLNLWDLTTVWQLNDYHPETATLNEEALLMFSFLVV